ncbi:hypothetical protein [Ochrobactrum soli]|nr:hypothetical protein [[Ochrobactrum] soli]
MKFGKNKSTLAMIATGAGGAAVAGFGLSLGRDIYKGTKKNGGNLLLLLAVIFCPFIGGRALVRGHDRGVMGTLFLTYIGSILLIAIGFVAASFLAFQGLAATSKETEAGSVIVLAVVTGASVTAFLAGIGMLTGLYQRPKRLRAFAVKRYNELFLADNGFKETDGKDITHYAPDGQALRFLEAHPGKLVFMAIGKRGKRAFIDLDENGRMLSYTGVV